MDPARSDDLLFDELALIHVVGLIGRDRFGHGVRFVALGGLDYLSSHDLAYFTLLGLDHGPGYRVAGCFASLVSATERTVS